MFLALLFPVLIRVPAFDPSFVDRFFGFNQIFHPHIKNPSRRHHLASLSLGESELRGSQSAKFPPPSQLPHVDIMSAFSTVLK